MNKHRLQRKSKKIQGRGFFSNIVSAVGSILKDKAPTFLRDQLNKVPSAALEGKAKQFVHDKLNEIFSKKKKHGAELKFL